MARLEALREWLGRRNALLLWEASADSTAAAAIECWQIAGRVILITIGKTDGWEIFTAPNTNQISETFDDAERRLGIGGVCSALGCDWPKSDYNCNGGHSPAPAPAPAHGGGSITDPDEAAIAARACESDDAAAALLFKGVGWRALLTLARRAGIKAGEQSNMTRAWCARLARAVRS